MKIDCKKILDEHETYIKDCLTRMEDFAPMIIVNRGEKRVPIIVRSLDGNHREAIKLSLERISKIKPDWVILMHEGYRRKFNLDEEDISKVEHGDVTRMFKEGDKSVTEVIIIALYTPTEKWSRVLDKKTFKAEKDCSEFEGWLTISDIDRVFWNHRKGVGQ